MQKPIQPNRPGSPTPAYYQQQYQQQYLPHSPLPYPLKKGSNLPIYAIIALSIICILLLINLANLKGENNALSRDLREKSAEASKLRSQVTTLQATASVSEDSAETTESAVASISKAYAEKLCRLQLSAWTAVSDQSTNPAPYPMTYGSAKAADNAGADPECSYTIFDSDSTYISVDSSTGVTGAAFLTYALPDTDLHTRALLVPWLSASAAVRCSAAYDITASAVTALLTTGPSPDPTAHASVGTCDLVAVPDDASNKILLTLTNK